jgi:hypothetical protein
MVLACMSTLRMSKVVVDEYAPEHHAPRYVYLVLLGERILRFALAHTRNHHTANANSAVSAQITHAAILHASIALILFILLDALDDILGHASRPVR